MKKASIVLSLTFWALLTGCTQVNKTSQMLPGKEMPLVYDKEDTSADVKAPPLPEFADLPSIEYLPDPFLMANNNRMTTKAQWRERRAEIKAMIEHYDVGEKPGKPSIFKASLDGNTINITVGEGENTIQMTAVINRPANAPADKPIPAIIGLTDGTGSLPGNLFSERGIATISYNANQIAPTMFMNINYQSGNFAKLYPDATTGFFVRWAWGVSRLIDALEMLPEAMIAQRRSDDREYNDPESRTVSE